MINNTALSKATKIKITPTRKSKNNVQHYAVIFYGIPFIDKNRRTYYSEIIFPDCTFGHNCFNLEQFINANNKQNKSNWDKYDVEITYSRLLMPTEHIVINNAQSFLYDTQFTFEYHEEPSTTKLFTVQYQEYPEED